MVWCKCGKLAIDGGSDYNKITGVMGTWDFVNDNVPSGNVELDKFVRQGARQIIQKIVEEYDLKNMKKAQIIQLLNLINNMSATDMDKLLNNKLELWGNPNGRLFFKEVR